MVRAAHVSLRNNSVVRLKHCEVVVSPSVPAARGGTGGSVTIELHRLENSFPFSVHSSYSLSYKSYKNTGNQKTL